MKTKEYKLIPLNEITDEAREIAVAWCENCVRMGFDIQQKHKLASDIINYADQQVQFERNKVLNWISVKDKTNVPKEFQLCLVWNTARQEGWEIEVQGFIPPRFTSKVTHWMPLPEPPQN